MSLSKEEILEAIAHKKGDKYADKQMLVSTLLENSLLDDDIITSLINDLKVKPASIRKTISEFVYKANCNISLDTIENVLHYRVTIFPFRILKNPKIINERHIGEFYGTNLINRNTIKYVEGINSLIKYPEKVNWKDITEYHFFNEEEYYKLRNYIIWDEFPFYDRLSDSLIEKLKDHINWELLLFYRSSVSEEFIENFEAYIDWEVLTITQRLSRKTLVRYSDRLNWDLVSLYQILPIDDIIILKPYLNYELIKRRRDLLRISDKRYFRK